MTIHDVQALMERGEYGKARQYMDILKEDGHPYTDELAVLDAGIYEAAGDKENMFRSVRAGLQYCYANYELYYMLGYYYLSDNIDQAYLCFQNALLYCDREEDAAVIANDMASLEETGQVTVHDTAIVIVSYNACYMMQKNIESIRDTLLKGSYRIIVVDNASDDGVREWIREQDDIILLENERNLGFAPACNQAVKTLRELGGEQEDIFLLNNDTRLAPNSLFWLRMGLYGGRWTGAVGSLSNYAGNEQQLDIEFTLPREYLDYGAGLNVPCENPYEERVRLSGFAMLVRGSVWDETGGMDEAFAPGYFEDDDLSMKILKAGYRLFLCHNSFIYHVGSQSFFRCSDVEDILTAHYQLFVRKYGFDILEYAYSKKESIEGIPFTSEDAFNLLQIGSGLGADLKYIRSEFPDANVIGIEKKKALYDISGKTELIFHDLEALWEMLKRPVFQVLLIDESQRGMLSREEWDIVRRLCLDSCVVLPKSGVRGENVSIPLDQVKLVIWDMDQTFWSGILSEGSVEIPQDRVRLIRELTDCGIMNSISSKNEEDKVLQALRQLDIAEYFVFNHINWENKGEQIRQKLEEMHLRPENVLFIDDDPRNLEEGKYYCPGLMTALPDVIPKLQEYIKGLGHSDVRHERLEHYKVLEKRRKEEKRSLTKEQFLYDSEIVLEIHRDCMNELDRIAELTARTNQLNYTKVRDGREKIKELLENKILENGYIKVRDKFGDYGVVGFFCYDAMGKKLRHFLFSCRIIGMGIEQCVYHWLGCPEMDTVEPVAVHLEESAEVPWIRLKVVREDVGGGKSGKDAKTNKIKVLLKGPCDMSAIESYLSGGDLTTEFNYVNDQGFITTGQNHSMHIWQSAVFSDKQIDDLIAEVPFMTSGDFQTSIFNREYHVICYSLLPDCHTGLYRNRNTGAYISFGSRNYDLTDPKNKQGYIDGSIVNHLFPFTEKVIDRFAREWEFVGVTAGEDLIRNLDYMYVHAIGSPMFILLLGSETEYEGINEEFANHAEHHKEINALVKAYAGDKDRIRIIEMTEYIHSQEDYEDSINHFSRNVYYQLATRVCAYINEKVEMLKGKKPDA